MGWVQMERDRYIRFVLRTRFLKIPQVDSSRLRLTYEGAYSLTPAGASMHMVRLVERTLRRPLRVCRVLECFAGHGGDTIPIVHYGDPQAIVCLEANADHRNNLRHNLRTYFPDAQRLRRVIVPPDACAVKFARALGKKQSAVQPSSTPCTASIAQCSTPQLMYDVVYMDPPWGGHHPVSSTSIRVRDREGRAVMDLLDLALAYRKLCCMVVLKLPMSFDTSVFAIFGAKNITVDDYAPAHLRYVLIH
jgi:16S rRNA G966 N2-methylase RsmD